MTARNDEFWWSSASGAEGGARHPSGFVIDPALRISDPRLSRLHEYWVEKCDGRAMPAANEIQPGDLVALLPHLLLLDVLDGGTAFRFRLIGTEIVALTGKDLTGTLLSPPASAALSRLEESLLAVVAMRRPVRTFSEWTAIPQRPMSGSECLYLPLAQATDELSTILGCVTLFERPPERA